METIKARAQQALYEYCRRYIGVGLNPAECELVTNEFDRLVQQHKDLLVACETALCHLNSPEEGSQSHDETIEVLTTAIAQAKGE